MGSEGFAERGGRSIIEGEDFIHFLTMVEIAHNSSENIILHESGFLKELQNLKSTVEPMDENDIVDKNISLFKKSPLLCSILPYEKLFAPDIPNAFTVIAGKIDKAFPGEKSFYKHLTVLALLCSNQSNKDINDLRLNKLEDSVFSNFLKQYLSNSIKVNFSDMEITCDKVKKILEQKQKMELINPHSTLYDKQMYEELFTGWEEDGRYVMDASRADTIKTIGTVITFTLGTGEYFARDGGYYKGGIVKSDQGYRLEGEGKYTWPNGSTYVGQWQNGLPNEDRLLDKIGEFKYYITNPMSESVQQIQLNGLFTHGLESFTGIYTDGEGVVHNNVTINIERDRSQNIDVLKLKEGEEELSVGWLNPSIIQTYPIQLVLQKREEKNNTSLQTSDK